MEAQYHELLTLAVEQGAKLVCLPEFSLLPYFPGTCDQSGFAWAEPLKIGPSAQFLGDVARVFGLFLVGSLYEKAADDTYYDTAVLVAEAGRDTMDVTSADLDPQVMNRWCGLLGPDIQDKPPDWLG